MKKVPLTDIRLYTHGTSKEKLEFINLFGKSLQEFGFVIVEGHGISDTLIRKCYSIFEDFFHYQ